MTLVRQDLAGAKEYEPGLVALKLVDGRLGARRLSLLRGWLKPGCRHEPHVHEVEEAILFLSGRGVQTIGDEQYEIGPGDSIHVPPGTPHSTLNTAEEDLVFVAAYADNAIVAQPASGLGAPRWPRVRHRLAWLLKQCARRLTQRRQHRPHRVEGPRQ